MIIQQLIFFLSWFLKVIAIVIDTDAVENGENFAHVNLDIRATYIVIDPLRRELTNEMWITEQGVFILITNRNGLFYYFAWSNTGYYENYGTFYVLDSSDTTKNGFYLYPPTFLNEGTFEFVLQNEVESSGYNFIVDSNFINNGVMKFSAASEDFEEGKVQFRNGGLLNEGSICLINFHAYFNRPPDGSGCIVLRNSIARLVSTIAIANDIYIFLFDGDSFVYEALDFQHLSVIIYGFQSGSRIVLNDIISSFTYDQSTGILSLVSGTTTKVYDIGTSYDSSMFELTSVYNSNGYDAVIYRGQVPLESRILPDTCLACGIPSVDYSGVNEGYANYIGDEFESIYMATSDAAGVWYNTTIAARETVTITTTADTYTTTQTYLYIYSIENYKVVTETVLLTEALSSVNTLITYETEYMGSTRTVTAYIFQRTDDIGDWIFMSDDNLLELETVTTRITNEESINDVEIIGYSYAAGVYYITSTLDDPTASTQTNVVNDRTEVVMITSNEENWWYTTTSTISRSSYTYTTVLSDENGAGTATHIVSANQDENDEWITQTSYHTPSHVTSLLAIETDVDDETSTVTALHYEYLEEDGDWVTTTDTDLLSIETFTTRVVVTDDGGEQTRDAEIVEYQFAIAGNYYVTNLLDDPIAATQTNVIDDKTEIVMVTSDEHNWWYTTTSTVPRSSYTYTTVLADENGAGTATHIISANQDENDDWITQTSYHTPSHVTSLVTMETTVDEDVSSQTALYYEYLVEGGDWVTATDTDLISVETSTSRVVVTDEGGEHTRDAEIVQYQFAIAGSYYITNLLDDPIESTETKVIEDRTEVVMVTSDEENWWYTTTSTVPRSSYTYTTVLTDEDGAGTATHIVSANLNENDEWITQTSYHTPSHVTSLITMETTVDEVVSSYTALHYEFLVEGGDWVTATDTELVSVETLTSRVVVTDEGVERTRDAEIVQYQFAIAGDYYITNLLDDPIASTETNIIEDKTEVVMVTSDEENWWHTTTSTILRSSYTYTTILTDENGFGTATHIVGANQDEDEDWITQTSYHTPSHITNLLTIETEVGGDTSFYSALHYEYLAEDGDWVTTTDTDMLSVETSTTRVVISDESGEYIKDAEIVQYQFAMAGTHFVTNLLNDPIASTETLIVDNGITEVVMVTSDEESWWYTTTSTVPRSSYTYTTVLSDENGFGTATHMIGANQDENEAWITQTSYHTPSHITSLITIEPDAGEDTNSYTALHYEYLDEYGDWVTTTDTDLLSVETFTSRVVITNAGGEYIKDAEIIQYQFALAGVYSITNLLEDPIASTETTIVDQDLTEIIMVTSDEENWWYTTTTTVPRSSYTYTSVLADENGVATATHIVSANQDESNEWITQTSYHTPSQVTTLITIETTIDEDVGRYTGLHYEYSEEGGDWITTIDSELISVETYSARVILTDGGEVNTKDAEILQYQFALAGYYYITNLLDDPTAATETNVVEDRTEVFMVTSDEENWWYTTTSTVSRSSYTYTTVLSDENGAGTATHIVSANQDENDEWITQTSYHTPSHVTSLLAIETDVDDETSTVTALHYEYLAEDGDWVTATDTDLLSIETFTTRVVVTDDGGEQTRDAEIVEYQFAIAGNYYVTNLLDDPIAATQTNVIDDKTEIVMVTSDEHNWWYTTTSTVPRSSYTYTTVLADENGAGTATHIISANQDENDDWITQTSYHTPSHVTSLVTMETTVDEDVSSQTALYYEYLVEGGDWVTATDTDLISVETSTSRVVVTDEGGEHTRDAEIVQYQFAIAGSYYITNLLDDPIESTETKVIEDRTEVVMVTSDEENWWYTTTSTVPRSSYTYTTVLTDEDGAGTATHIVSANLNENDEWITQTSYHTPSHVTSLITMETTVDEVVSSYTALHYEFLVEGGDWVTATDTELVSVETLTSRVVVTDEGVERTRDAEIVQYQFAIAGDYYITNLLDDPIASTETNIIEDKTEVVMVTSDEENWWHTTTSTILRSSYTYTTILTDENGFGTATHIVGANQDEDEDWITQTSYHTPSHITNLLTIETEVGGDTSFYSALHYEYLAEDGDWVTTTDTDMLSVETSTTRVVISDESGEYIKDAEIVQYQFAMAGTHFVTNLLNDPIASTETLIVDNGITEVVMVTSDEESWWYTTTSTVPRSSYTYTTVLSDENGFGTATHMIGANQDENEAWITQTSYHTPSHITSLITIEPDAGEDTNSYTALHHEYLDEYGDWVTTTDTDLLSVETFTSRVVITNAGGEYIKDAEIIQYQFALAGVYSITNLLEDPIASTETTIVDQDLTEIIMVTSDEENWWYTTTTTVPRSSYTYTSVLADENGVATATHIVSANQDESNEWITQTSYHTPSQVTTLITIETTIDEDVGRYTGLHYEYSEEGGDWITTIDSELISVETYSARVILTDGGEVNTKDAEILQYQFALAGYYYITNLLDDPTAATETNVVEDRTEVFMVTSDEENWWYTTTSTVSRSSYTYTTVLSDENGAGTATHIVSANQDENDEWITQTSYHTPSHVTSLLAIETDVDDETSTVTALHYEYLAEDGDWVTATDTDLLSIETFTTRVVVTDDGGEQTRDAEIVEYQFAIAGNYYVTNLLDDPIAATQTNVIDDKTEIVMVTSDEHNWWYTTTSTVPRSSYTYTTVLADENGAGTATHIISANQDENDDWITQTSYHTPSHVTSLVTIETTVDEDVSSQTALYYEYLVEGGDWVTATDTDLISVETSTSRVVVTDEGGEHTRDAEIVQYQFAIAGSYYITNLLDDPIASTETKVIEDRTEVVMVTSDEENWWYTTTSTVPRSSYTYTTVLTDEDGAGTATHIVSANLNENDEWITQTSYHTPSHVTSLITMETTVDEVVSSYTALHYEFLVEGGDWVTATDTDLISVETSTSRVVVTDEGVERTRDAEIVQYQFAIAGDYYITNLLDDPIASTETNIIEDKTEVVMVTSDEENWWHTTTSTILRSSYTYTTILTDENGFGTATHIVGANQDEDEDWITQTSYHTPSHITNLLTIETEVGGDTSFYSALHYEYLAEDGDWVTTTDTDMLSVETSTTRVVISDESGEYIKDAEIVQYQFAMAGTHFVTNLLNDPIASTETLIVDNGITEVVMVTSDEESWWYTTTSTVPRSSYTYTTVLSDENGFGTATHMIGANQDENEAWITQTSYHTPSHITSLITIEPDAGEDTNSYTALHHEYLDEYGDWVTTTDTDLLSVETFTSRVVITNAGGEYIKDAEIIQYQFALAGVYSITNLLEDPIASTETTIVDQDLTEIIMVTSDEENWWYTTTTTVPRSSYTYTSVLADENGVATATHIVSANQDESNEWITQTSYHTPSQVTTLITIETTIDEDVGRYTGLHYEYSEEGGDWITTIDSELISVETYSARVILTDGGEVNTKDAEILQYQFALAGYYYITNLLDDPTAATETNVVEDRTEVFMVTSDEENWWYTTTSTVSRSSYTYTTVLSDENGAGTATHIVSANQDENDEWITQTSYHTPSHVTSLLAIETDVDDETSTVTALHYEYLAEDGDWVTATDTDLLSIETFTTRVVVTDDGGEQTRDAEIVEYQFAIAGNYYVTNLLDDPIAATQTNVIDDKTEIVMVTSDEHNWWYTTTSTVPRSSYTYTTVLADENGAGTATHIISANQDENDDWITQTSYHTPSHVTSLVTIETTVDEDVSSQTALYYEYLVEGGDWVTATDTDLISVETSTSRVVVTDEGGEHTRDAEIVQYQFAIAGSYYITNLLDDPIASTETKVIEDRTEVVMVTSDEENWWYTTTSTVPRSSYTYTTVLTDEDGAGTATHIVSANLNENDEWITQTSYHTPSHVTSLITMETTVDEVVSSYTALHYEFLVEGGDWVTATDTDLISVETSTSRVVVTDEGVERTRDAEIVQYQFAIAGDYYITNLLDDPIASTETNIIEDKTEVVMVTSDEENWWHTTTSTILRSSYTYTTILTDENGFGTATHIVGANQDEDEDWITQTSYHTPSHITNLLTIETEVGGDTSFYSALHYEYLAEDGDWVTTTDTDMLSVETSTTRVVISDESGEYIKDAEIVQYQFAMAGTHFVTNLLNDPIASTETLIVDNGITEVVMVTSDEESWWYTTTSTVPRSSYTYTTVLSDENGFGTATHMIGANQDENEAWITQTSYHTPSHITSLITIEPDAGEDTNSYTALHHEYLDEYGDWVTTTDTDLLSVETFTSRVVITNAGGEYIKDAEIIQYQFALAGVYSITNLLEDPIASTETTIVDQDLTEIIMVTSDEENWWYTTTTTVPRSSYTYTSVLADENGVATATHIVSANQDESNEWITQTSYHTPSQVTTLITIETTLDEDVGRYTGLHYEYSEEGGDWITTIDSELISVETYSARVILTDEGEVYTKDAEILQYQFALAGYYYITNLLDDPTAATETNVVEDRTEVFMVTSDEQNWWYTTTSTVSRSSYIYTTVLSDENGFGTATHIVSATQNENEDWITQTSYHTPSHVTSLITLKTGTEDESSSVTALHYEYLDQNSNWVTATDSNLMTLETYTSRLVISNEDGEFARDAEIVLYQFATAGDYYITSLLKNSVPSTETFVGERNATDIDVVTSDEERWGYTSTYDNSRRPYTNTTVLSNERTATHISETNELESMTLQYEDLDENDDWVTAIDSNLLTDETVIPIITVTEVSEGITTSVEMASYEFASTESFSTSLSFKTSSSTFMFNIIVEFENVNTTVSTNDTHLILSDDHETDFAIDDGYLKVSDLGYIEVVSDGTLLVSKHEEATWGWSIDQDQLHFNNDQDVDTISSSQSNEVQLSFCKDENDIFVIYMWSYGCDYLKRIHIIEVVEKPDSDRSASIVAIATASEPNDVEPGNITNTETVNVSQVDYIVEETTTINASRTSNIVSTESNVESLSFDKDRVTISHLSVNTLTPDSSKVVSTNNGYTNSKQNLNSDHTKSSSTISNSSLEKTSPGDDNRRSHEKSTKSVNVSTTSLDLPQHRTSIIIQPETDTFGVDSSTIPNFAGRNNRFEMLVLFICFSILFLY